MDITKITKNFITLDLILLKKSISSATKDYGLQLNSYNQNIFNELCKSSKIVDNTNLIIQNRKLTDNNTILTEKNIDKKKSIHKLCNKNDILIKQNKELTDNNNFLIEKNTNNKNIMNNLCNKNDMLTKQNKELTDNNNFLINKNKELTDNTNNLSKIISIQYEKIGKSFFEKTNNELYYSANLDLLTKKNKELTDKINGLTQQQQSIDYYIDSINQIRNTQSNKRKHNDE